MRLMSSEQIDVATKAYEGGASMKEAAALVGFSTQTVKRKLVDRGVVIRKTRRRTLSSAQEDTVIEMYLSGNYKNTEVLEAVGLPGTSVDVLYSLLRARGVPRKLSMTALVGKTAPVGHVTKTSEGYLVERVPDDWKFLGKMKGYGSGKWITQHRKVMAEHLDRPLTKHDVVHHRDGDRTNNDISNLQLVTPGSHSNGQAYRCCACGSEDVEPVDLRVS